MISNVIPKYLTSFDIKRIRKSFGMTQKEFSNFVGVSKPTVERWETTDKKITGPICSLICLLEARPFNKEILEVPKKKLPLRLWYMCGNVKCTMIDVDESKKIVSIKNFVSDISRCAFGANMQPTYEDYEELLKSRCFPETRDGIKIILEDLGLPFYDPLLIIQKTEGRMAEDSFWIDVEG